MLSAGEPDLKATDHAIKEPPGGWRAWGKDTPQGWQRRLPGGGMTGTNSERVRSSQLGEEEGEGRRRKDIEPGQFGARLKAKKERSEATLGIRGQVTEGLWVSY